MVDAGVAQDTFKKANEICKSSVYQELLIGQIMKYLPSNRFIEQNYKENPQAKLECKEKLIKFVSDN